MKEKSDIWGFIYELLFEYTGVNFREISLDSSAVREIEHNLGIKLPESIKRWVAFSCNSEKIAAIFSYRDCFEVRWLEQHGALSILLQGENDYHWAIKRKDLKCSDPPVFGYGLAYEIDETSFVERGEWACSVSSFALDYILSYFIPTGGGFCCLRGNIPIDNQLNLTANFGDISLSLRDDILVYTNNNPENWNYHTYNVYFLTKESAIQKPDNVKWLKENAKIICTLGSYKI